MAPIHTWEDFRFNPIKAGQDPPGQRAALLNLAAYKTLRTYGHQSFTLQYTSGTKF